MVVLIIGKFADQKEEAHPVIGLSFFTLDLELRH